MDQCLSSLELLSATHLRLPHFIDHALSVALRAKNDVNPSLLVGKVEAPLLLAIKRRAAGGDILEMFGHTRRLTWANVAASLNVIPETKRLTPAAL